MFLIIIFGLFLSSQTFANDRPQLQELLIPRNLAENKTLKLNCNSLSGDLVEFNWFLNDEKLDTNDRRKIILHDGSSELIIKELSESDLGEIKCVGRNKFGQDSQRASLVFNVTPKWIIEPRDILTLYGNKSKIQLECDVKSYPSSVVEWFKLDESKQKMITEFKSNRISFELSKGTAGFYKCLGQNSVGSIEKIIKVSFHGK